MNGFKDFYLNDFSGLCGCGRKIRYVNIKDGLGACNKYSRCPSYDEIMSENRKLCKENSDLKNILRSIKKINDLDI